jgi:hypothetical protein
LIKDYKDYETGELLQDFLSHGLKMQAPTERIEEIKVIFKRLQLQLLKQIKDTLSREGIIKVDNLEFRIELQEIRYVSPIDEDPLWKRRSLYIGPDVDEILDSMYERADEFEAQEERAREIGTIIVGQSTPSILSHYLSEIRDCYKYGLFDAAA